MTAASSNEGEFETSTTTWAPASAGASPSPVSVFTPESGDAANTSWPRWRSVVTSLDPMSPVPPMTTIFMCRLLQVGCGRYPEAIARRVLDEISEDLFLLVSRESGSACHALARGKATDYARFVSLFLRTGSVQPGRMKWQV